jgi:hypothetical protein
MVMGNLAAVTHGAAMVYPGEGFDPLVTLETVQSERCTALYGCTPPMPAPPPRTRGSATRGSRIDGRTIHHPG